jgi:hypothetical protein
MAALEVSLLFAAMCAGAATLNLTRIKILDSESHSVVLDGSGVPKNCDGINFDAYCHSSQSVQMTNTLLVQEEDGSLLRVACAVDSRWSRCALLPQGESFDARIERHGITVYYQDDRGKPRKQLYTQVAPDAKVNASAAATPLAPRLAPVNAENAGQALAAPATAPLAPRPTMVRAEITGQASAAPAAAPLPPRPAMVRAEITGQASAAPAAAPLAPRPAPVPAENTGQALAAPAATPPPMGLPPQTVKCSIASTPSGAEITVDGRFAGSTPSVLALPPGTHSVIVSTPGFTPWKRDLAVSSGSELTVNAVLRRAR